ncbi:lipoprotein [Xanthomonas sp. A2111]|uniref:Lipoprotein n=1 Tax=Xanthomonas hawaiiensis TaxID=3003247 RepID=A0ABU2I6X2_9XANT|nr:lipoprotein [Xanthomonas sp. A2111]MBO9829340.1 lipoprotein [Xanthomonas sp. A2111]MDS9993899.1 lipoprotein [Xanthomonas sp. A2111]
MSTSSSSPIRLVLSAAALLALAGCGNKGPLVMPQKPVPVEAAPATPAPDATPPATTDPAGQAQPVDGQRTPANDTTTPTNGNE